MKKFILLLLTGLSQTGGLFAQGQLPTYMWNNIGKTDNSFYLEANWIDAASGKTPVGDVLQPGKKIDAHLLITDTSAVIGGQGGIAPDIFMGSGSLVLTEARVKMQAGGKIVFSARTPRNLVVDNGAIQAEGLAHASVELRNQASLRLASGSPLEQSILDITGTDVAVYFENIKANQVATELIATGKITVNAKPAVPYDFDADLQAKSAGTPPPDYNVLITQYYAGSVVRSYGPGAAARGLIGFSGKNGAQGAGQKGSRNFSVGFHRGVGEASLGDGSMMTSFCLKKGFAAVLAIAEKTSKSPGQGNTWVQAIQPYWKISKSRYYAAMEKDLCINLAADLSGKVNFVKVTPWNYVRKKGLCTTNNRTEQMQGDWYYNWWSGKDQSAVIEFIPMIKTKEQAGNNGVWDRFTHVISDNPNNPVSLLAINEPKGPEQGNMLEFQDAVDVWPRFLETGTRLGSPAPKEAGPSYEWLDGMSGGLNKLGYRMDFVALHWYDWGGWGKDQNPNANPAEIFARFKTWLDNMHKRYQRPLWITEFNANKNRVHGVQEGFLKLALPYLENLDFVERYSYFEPGGGLGNYYEDDAKTILSSVGKVYRNQVSGPAISGDVLYDRKAGDVVFTPKPEPTTQLHRDESHLALPARTGARLAVVNNRIVLDSPHPDKTVHIHAVDGLRLKSVSAQRPVDISALPRGVYIAKSTGTTALRFSVIK